MDRSISGMRVLVLLVTTALVVQLGPAMATAPEEGPRSEGRCDGVNIAMGQDDIDKLNHLHPEEIKSTNITFSHLVDEEDTFIVTIAVDYHGLEDNGWGVWFDDDDEFVLGPSESMKGRIHAQGPSECMPGDYITVNITITSTTNSSKTCSFEFDILSNCPAVAPKCSCAVNIQMVEPGIPEQYIFDVWSMDSVPRDIELTMRDSPYAWNYELEPMNMSFEGSEMRHAYLNVTAPDNTAADIVGSFTIRASKVGFDNLTVECTVHAIVEPHVLFYMEVVGSNVTYVDPGEMVVFEIRAHHEGNLGHNLYVIFELVSTPSGDWEFYQDKTSASIPPNSNETFHISIIAPHILAGERERYCIEGHDEAEVLRDEVCVEIIINQVHSLLVDIMPDNVTLDPGETAAFDISMTNRGNGVEELNLSFEGLPEGWSERLPRNIALNMDEDVYITGEVLVPADEVVGSFTIHLNVTTADGERFLFPLEVHVDLVPFIDLVAKETKLVGEPGTTVIFGLTITNLGNGKDTVDLLVDRDIPENWNVWILLGDLDVSYLDLDMGRTVDLVLKVDIPLQPEDSVVYFDILAASRAGFNDSVDLTVEIEMTNLRPDSILFNPSEMRKGDVVEVFVVVKNVGTAKAAQVPVELYIDEVYQSVFIVDWLPAGSSKDITFVWQPTKKGKHIVKVLVDPDDAIFEENEIDNELEVEVQVKAMKKDAQTPGFGGPMLLLALMAASVTVLRRRRKRPHRAISI